MSDEYTLRNYELPRLTLEEIKTINVALQLTFNLESADFAINGLDRDTVRNLLAKISRETSRQEIIAKHNVELEQRRLAGERSRRL